MKVLIAGGGTAGHVFPALALAESLARSHGAEVVFLGTRRGLEGRLVPAAGFELIEVRAAPLPRRLSSGAIIAPFALIRAISAGRSLVRRGDVVVGMGGYVSAPAVGAAIRERIPVVLHEQNAVPGVANRLAARWAKVIALSFSDAGRYLPGSARKVLTGNPVRSAISRVREERTVLREEAMRELDLDPSRATVVIFGGSQGALHLNRGAIAACVLLGARADLQILLLTGPAHHESMSREAALRLPAGGHLRLRLLPFLDRMELAYASADLVVSRAGATSIAETTAVGVPSLLVPYPYATARHQEANARALRRAGGAEIMLDEDVNGETLASKLEELLSDRDRLQRMAGAAASWGRVDAADHLARLVAEVAG